LEGRGEFFIWEYVIVELNNRREMIFPGVICLASVIPE
jgi:hypothetical protein